MVKKSGNTDYIVMLKSWNELSFNEKDDCCNYIIDTALDEKMKPEDIAQLAEALAHTGSLWTWPKDVLPILDFSSTGGPGSLTTLLCPFLIATEHISVSQVSVPSTVAGAIDTLSNIPGFSIQLSYDMMLRSIRTSGIAHTMNSDEQAPADLLLFKKRIQRNAKNVPDLVIASLLAKKISSGVTNVIFDARVGKMGNFGQSVSETRNNSKKLIRVGKLLNIKCICIMTNHTYTPMPAFGRMDNLRIFLSIINGKQIDDWTKEHLQTTIEIASICCQFIKGGNLNHWENKINKSISNGTLKNLVSKNLESQGSHIEKLVSIVDSNEKCYPIIVHSKYHGYIHEINLQPLVNIFQQLANKSLQFQSLLNVSLLRREGDFVSKGDKLMVVRSPPEIYTQFENEIEKIYIVKDNHKKVNGKRIFEVVSDD